MCEVIVDFNEFDDGDNARIREETLTKCVKEPKGFELKTYAFRDRRCFVVGNIVICFGAVDTLRVSFLIAAQTFGCF